MYDSTGLLKSDMWVERQIQHVTLNMTTKHIPLSRLITTNGGSLRMKQEKEKGKKKKNPDHCLDSQVTVPPQLKGCLNCLPA